MGIQVKIYCAALVIILFMSKVDTSERPNLLFLVSDDMRPELGCYEDLTNPPWIHPGIYTPNLDRLADRSLLLTKAYAQVAFCNPSRSSLLTSRRPDTTQVYYGGYFRQLGGDFVTIPQYFKENGYASIGMGKVFHPGEDSGFDDPVSWSRPYYYVDEYWNEIGQSWKAVSKDESIERQLPDSLLAEKAVDVLREFASSNATQPLFLAVGFFKPHIPIVFPEEFLHYYPTEDVKLPSNPYVPKNFPNIAWNSCRGIVSYGDTNELKDFLPFNTSLPDWKTLELRRAYYSAVSYIDSLVGQIVQEVELLGLSDKTIIVFLGDHGYMLGEHNEWCKQSNLELATQAPLMLHIPGHTDHGIATDSVTEFVDLFPTLVEAAGLPALPKCPSDSKNISHCTEGQSFLSLLRKESPKWKNVATSQIMKAYSESQKWAMGYSMRTESYRYTEWHGMEDDAVDWDNLIAVELYDHSNDPNENFNVAEKAEYATTRQQLENKLRKINQ